MNFGTFQTKGSLWSKGVLEIGGFWIDTKNNIFIQEILIAIYSTPTSFDGDKVALVIRCFYKNESKKKILDITI